MKRSWLRFPILRHPRLFAAFAYYILHMKNPFLSKGFLMRGFLIFAQRRTNHRFFPGTASEDLIYLTTPGSMPQRHDEPTPCGGQTEQVIELFSATHEAPRGSPPPSKC
jgi:hypothetical protein